MNRLRESKAYSIGERWMLASAYKLAGKADVANTLAQHDRLQALCSPIRIPTPSARCCGTARWC